MPITGNAVTQTVGRCRRRGRDGLRAGAFGLVVATLAGMAATAPVLAQEFPLREKYEAVGVEAVETAELAASFESMIVVDARSEYEYQTLHIQDAHSIPLASRGFAPEVVELAQSSGQPLVFYCNGELCAVSYRAAARALEAGVEDARVYDAGVFAWANAHPERAVLLGQPLGDPGRLISSEEFKAHLLGEDAFYARIDAQAAPLIVDIRTRKQRQGVSLFQARDRHVPLTDDSGELDELIEQAKAEGREMFFIDATGKQVRWLQYYLEDRGLSDYWFLEGGAASVFESMGL
ncbi:MAG: rhodanese-like domain-containing protein [Wenzhouxiangella sp.]|jgi:rhodanese-related sulfurtransferase|nr:rhodanese-like domain-containing protein [Wenzhouxiangella sp.]